MGQVSRTLRRVAGGYGYWCPGCRDMHVIGNGWKFNGDLDRPTFTPSILVTSGHYTPHFQPGDACWCTYRMEHPDEADSLRFRCERCHTYVTGGQIQFLSDCTHELAGQTVPLPPFPAELADAGG